jgi:hypothetical protein
LACGVSASAGVPSRSQTDTKTMPTTPRDDSTVSTSAPPSSASFANTSETVNVTAAIRTGPS